MITKPCVIMEPTTNTQSCHETTLVTLLSVQIYHLTPISTTVGPCKIQNILSRL